MTTVEYTVTWENWWGLYGAYPNADYLFNLDSGWNNWTGYCGEAETICGRFPEVTIPVGATITKAYLIAKASGLDGNGGSSEIYFEKAANPANLTDLNNYNARTQSTYHVTWTIGGTWSTGTWYNSPELKTIIQELVSAYDYHLGAAMIINLIGQPGSGCNDCAMADVTVGAAILHIEYTTGGGVTITDSMLRTFDRGLDIGVDRGMQ